MKRRKRKKSQDWIIVPIIILALTFFLYHALKIIGLAMESDALAGLSLLLAMVIYYICGKNIMKYVR